MEVISILNDNYFHLTTCTFNGGTNYGRWPWQESFDENNKLHLHFFLFNLNLFITLIKTCSKQKCIQAGDSKSS